MFYYDGASHDTGFNASLDTWQLGENNHFNYTANTFDMWLNDAKIKSGATMWATALYGVDVLKFSQADTTTGHDVWLDNVLVRKWTVNEPSITGSGPPSGLPTVTTQAATGVSGGFATCNGNITDTGLDPTCDKRGFVYGTTSHGDPGNVAPGASGYDTFIEETGAFGTGAFADLLSSLTPGDTYFFRAYAHNSSGYAYGGEQTFTTPTVDTLPATNIASDQATGNGDFNDATNVDQIGFQWGVVPGGPYPNTVFSNTPPFFAGNYSMQLTGLLPLTDYYYRAAVQNTVSGWAYGGEVHFKTISPLPKAQTDAPSSITDTSFNANGRVTSTGGDPACDTVGFVYDTASHGDPGNVAPGASGYSSYVQSGGSYGVAPFTLPITGLTANTIYYVRAYSHNSYGYAYGGELLALTNNNSNILVPIGCFSCGIRFDSSPGGGYPNPYSGTIPHPTLCNAPDTNYYTGGIWGYLSGNFVYEYNYWNDNFYTDLYEMSNPVRRDEGIVKIKYKARLLKTAYPFGKFKREIYTHGVKFSSAAFNIIPSSGLNYCEIFYNNPATGLPWTVAEADDVKAGVTLGQEGSFGVAACDMVRLIVLWANAAARADGATNLGGTMRRLFGTVMEDESEACTVFFQWGATTAYGNVTAPQTKSKGQAFTADVDIGALPSIHFRAVIQTPCGETFYSNDSKFPKDPSLAQGTLPHRMLSGGFI
jgi:hypothetical protein